MKRIVKSYDAIIAPENLWLAWTLFRRGKRHRDDVIRFEWHLEKHLLKLRDDLMEGKYRHGGYRTFTVYDPKRRNINVPIVRDRIVHQAVWNVLFPFFDGRFTSSVHSCRPGHGTHKAVGRIRKIGRRIEQTKGVAFVLYIDIVKFFDSCGHTMLKRTLRSWIRCEETLWLLGEIIASYDLGAGRGIPLGNLTSQLFCNVMFMPFDRVLEEQGWSSSYVRYGDDCFILSHDKRALEELCHECSEMFGALGFRARIQVRRLQGFEALGRRFFTDGVSLRRGTRLRSISKVVVGIKRYHAGRMGMAKLHSRVQSHFGLVQPFSDPRWEQTLRSLILKADSTKTL